MTFEYYVHSGPNAVAVSKNKKGLVVETIPRMQRKYLGEPEDPHFIPSSPIIERAVFSEQEDDELRRICALALADVPHSDSPDPVIPQTTTRPRPSIPRKVSAPVQEVTKASQAQTQAADTRTPSEASKRDTVGSATDYCTPSTSAGITPADHKRLSAGKSQNSSNIRFDTWQQQQQQQRSKSHALPPPLKFSKTDVESRRPSAPVTSAERTLRIVKESPRESSTGLKDSQDSQPNRLSHVELNKTLPPLPQSNDDDEAPKTAPLARMLRTINWKKNNSSALDDDACPTYATRPSTRLDHIRSAPGSPATGTKKKLAVRFRMFGRREIHNRGIAVS